MSNRPKRSIDSRIEAWLRGRPAQAPLPATEPAPGLTFDGVPVFAEPERTRTAVAVTTRTPPPGTKAAVLASRPLLSGWTWEDELTDADRQVILAWRIQHQSSIQRQFLVMQDQPEAPESVPEPPKPEPERRPWDQGWTAEP